ncbi:thioredoxin [Bariatricus massiliensis]|uniref:Thioredoxin n=1 Tax=Bariatricus massiliensis TaxID=1745713 RepID=A0ABS8DEA6_9FIRM|nr:thioredoxin [Bariatricus massiliensis]MCB7302870.1 thioredoxin [Bariatricus massiliensis]MCB7374086.1 thioredoxin [Bariatricus massiliensis]MCB7386756.1 thioredoxin [Bariatricus massiliensis]MCB7410918.1 thioredoxin [Bariatricus massiliensis]MCQ5251744.1 thioredoxin [Bariatricus massiliensis]
MDIIHIKKSIEKENKIMAAIHITKENFQKEVLESDKPVLVDFWAEWCGPCQMVLPIIEEIADDESEVKVCKVNVDEQMELARQYQVMSIPTFLVFKDGKVIKREMGAKSKVEIMSMF